MVLKNEEYLKCFELDNEMIKKIRSSVCENVGKKLANMLNIDCIDIDSFLKK